MLGESRHATRHFVRRTETSVVCDCEAERKRGERLHVHLSNRKTSCFQIQIQNTVLIPKGELNAFVNQSLQRVVVDSDAS